MTINLLEIPEGSVEIQTGLWLYTYEYLFNGETRTGRKLYSSDGYCFYNKTAEIYDEEGNLIPEDEVQPSQRTYMQYAALGKYDSPDNYVSVPVDSSYEIVSKPNTSVVA